MKKFLIVTPGRTASTSLFNHIRNSLVNQSIEIEAQDRAAYTDEEMTRFNTSKYAAFTLFNPYKFPFVVEEINPAEWCLIVLTRHDFSNWLLSMISIHATGEWHPGKDHVVTSFKTTQEDFMGAYWYYRCWTSRVENVADEYNFGKVLRLDFNELIADWSAAGKKIGNWEWQNDSRLMKLGMTTSWNAVENIDDILKWIPSNDIDLIEKIKNSL
jgi:hypothetical protein